MVTGGWRFFFTDLQEAHEAVALFGGTLRPLFVEGELGESVVVQELAEENGELFAPRRGVALPQNRAHLVVLGADERLGLCRFGIGNHGLGCAGGRFLGGCGTRKPERSKEHACDNG